MYLQSIYKLRDEIGTHETGMNLAFDYLFGTSKNVCNNKSKYA